MKRMDLVTKSNHRLGPNQGQQGQISIFFSASIVVLISIIAFVINVGLFVKAKINLQNATDAAAFSGAAVQARQLTKIAYLNWEMRNIYKEWMYKYYVVGNLNTDEVINPEGETMNFRLEDDVNAITTARAKDPYNFPAVCIHLSGSKTNICRKYAIPGLPEFGGYNLPGAEEASRAFIDTLIGSKVDDCVDRSRLNMLVATTWAFNVLSQNMDDTLAGQGPAILADRQGAWPRAMELAMRMRNLEYAMNRPAETKGVCNLTSEAGLTGCSLNISDVIGEKKLGNERLVKAFYSGYRNLGNAVDNEMKETFTLREIAPKAVGLGSHTSASYLLVPEAKVAGYQKQYVDLKLMMVNLATFFAAMIPRGTGDTSGACDVSKVAFPIPGYPMGFYKNPDLVTYYAVKGEAEFYGMFNPFGSEPIKLTAYSAAKPFGGRIGPMLFVQRPGQEYFVGRTDNLKYRSVPYISSLDVVGTPIKGDPTKTLVLGQYEAGAPLPINSAPPAGYFWLKSPSSPLGGLVTNTEGVQFGIPNLVYDYQSGFSSDNYTDNGEQIHTIKPSEDTSTDKAIGLFSTYQFKAFKGTIGGSVTVEELDGEIARVRAPTRYEAANYLIPTPNDFNITNGVDSFGFISGPPEKLANGVSRYHANVYAPLYRSNTDQVDLLYESKDELLSSIFGFMRAQQSGIDKYKIALNQGAKAIFDMRNKISGAASGSAESYRQAASGVSDIDFDNPDVVEQIPATCKSLAGQFLYYYYGDAKLFPNDYVQDPTGCPKPLGTLLSEYFSAAANDPNYQPTHYKMDYSWNENNFSSSPNQALDVFTAYMPGPFNGIGGNGKFETPFPGSGISEMMRRNFYSTKFVTLESLRGGSGSYAEKNSMVIYSEGDLTTSPGFDRSQSGFLNTLDPNIDLSSINY